MIVTSCHYIPEDTCHSCGKIYQMHIVQERAHDQYQITVYEMKHHHPIGDIRAHDSMTVELASTRGICSCQY